MKSNHNQSQQVETQNSSIAGTQLLNEAASCSINAVSIPEITRQQIRCVSPMTFAQKLYQYNQLEIAEQFEPAIAANSLAEMKNLLNRVFELNS